MKLSSFQLEAQLAKKLLPVYIVSGDEPLLKNDALNAIRKTAKQAGFTERTRLSPQAGFDWEQLYSLLYSGSLMAEKRLFELDFRDITPNKAASDILKDYAQRPSPDNVLLIDTAKIDDKMARSGWYTALEKIGAVVTIWPIPREQLTQWIMNRAKKYKLTFQIDAANLLADYIEGNLVAAAQAIEKIYLLQPQQAVSTELIASVLTDESRFTVFDFVENAIAGHTSRTLHMLENLKMEGTEAVLVLWSITRELRMLADLAQQIKQGHTLESLFPKYRIFARRQAAVKRFLTTFTKEDCWRYLSHAAEIDKIIKGFAPGNAWEALQMFCLRLAK